MNIKNYDEKTKMLVYSAAIAALYATLTIALAPVSYGPVQLRLSEIMILLVLVNPRFKTGLILGCLIANLFSPFGIVDVIFGTLATAIAVIAMSKIKNIYLASLVPALSNGIIIGLELMYMLNLPFVETALYVALGELLVVTVIGVPLFKIITSRFPAIIHGKSC